MNDTPTGRQETRPATPQASARPPEKLGLECPVCACQDLRVIYTRRTPCGRLVRRRECRHCGKRMTTSESVIAWAEIEPTRRKGLS